MPEEDSELSKLSAAVPYLMSLLSILLLGFVFLALNGELLQSLLGFGSLETITSKRLMFALAVTLPIGFLVQQFAGFLSMVSARLFKCWKRFEWDCFNPQICLDNLEKRTRRLISECGVSNYEWQWEYFNYCQYWGLFTNGLLFVVFHFKSLLAWEGWKQALLVLGLTWLWLQAANRSRITYKIHDVCTDRAKILRPDSNPLPRPTERM